MRSTCQLPQFALICSARWRRYAKKRPEHLEKNSMDQFENNLREALLRRPKPPVLLAAKVMARVAIQERQALPSVEEVEIVGERVLQRVACDSALHQELEDEE